MELAKKRVGVWIRVSTEMQVYDESPSVHRQRAKDYAASHDWEVVEFYQLDGVSGAAIMGQPQARKMLHDVRTGRIEALLFTRLERVGRDALELLQIEKELRDHGAHLISIFEEIDTSTPEGKKRFQDLASQAEYDRARLAAKVKAGIHTRMKMGQVFTSQAVFGYRKIGKTLEPHPQEREVLALMYELFLEYRRFKTVARELNRRGFRMRTGNEFTNVSVKRLLQDSTAKGLYIANRTGNKQGGGKVIKPQSEWYEIDVPAIISSETWEKVQQIIKSLEKPRKRNINAYSGLLRCHCGTVMYLRKNDKKNEVPKYFCRNCKNKIRLQVLDSAIGDVIEGFMLDTLPPSVLLEADPESEQIGRKLQSVKDELEKVVRKLERLVILWEDGEISRKLYSSRYDSLAQRQQQIEQELSALEFELLADEGREAAREKLAEAKAKEISWQELDGTEKSEILRQFVKEITLKHNEITINMLYVPKQLNTNELACKGDHTDGHVK
ncbi:MAG: hypothetical protein CVV27_02925 [Candidatus Melainabacteria bacterium HGW-Melainabacteria-1]|nr:MAG: hypothetical protein CVV27_02925 [Candidatus Melainabacteria bacterium HGW-Melainabacteria-1]